MNQFIYFIAQALRRFGVDFAEDRDPRVLAMRQRIQELGSIQFHIEISPDGSWVAESTNIDGILSGGSNTRSMSASLRDAIFTYFEIPPHLCNDTLIKTSHDKPMQLEKHAYV